MTSRLYEITEALEHLMYLMDDGEEGWEAVIEELEGAWETKAEGVVKVIRMYEASADAKTAESERLHDSAVKEANRAKSLHDYLKANMERLETTETKTPLFKLRIQNNPPAVKVDDWQQVPMAFLKATITLSWEEAVKLGLTENLEPTIDRRGLLAHYKDVEDKPEGIEITQGTHLRIT